MRVGDFCLLALSAAAAASAYDKPGAEATVHRPHRPSRVRFGPGDTANILSPAPSLTTQRRLPKDRHDGDAPDGMASWLPGLDPGPLIDGHVTGDATSHPPTDNPQLDVESRRDNLEAKVRQ